MRATIFAAALVLLIPAGALAESAPKPGPEVQALGYYVGAWRGHGETKAGPFGPAGKLSTTNRCAWFAGGFQLVCRGEEHGPGGTRAFMALKSYDAKTRTYPEYSISSLGESEYDRGGMLTGKTLTYTVEQNIGGKHAKFRYTEVHVSPDFYTYKTDVAIDGGARTLLATGEVRRVK